VAVQRALEENVGPAAKVEGRDRHTIMAPGYPAPRGDIRIVEHANAAQIGNAVLAQRRDGVHRASPPRRQTRRSS
jgi:hypothetical protein